MKQNNKTSASVVSPVFGDAELAVRRQEQAIAIEAFRVGAENHRDHKKSIAKSARRRAIKAASVPLSERLAVQDEAIKARAAYMATLTPEQAAKESVSALGPRRKLVWREDGKGWEWKNIRPAYIPSDGIMYRPPEHVVVAAKGRKARTKSGFVVDTGYVLSGVPIPASGFEYPHEFKSIRLGTDAAERWPNLVPKSRRMRVVWQRGSVGSQLALKKLAMDAGVPDWMLSDDAAEIAPDPMSRVLEDANFKIVGLDAPNVEGNKDLLGFLRLDTDLIWRSPRHCRRALEKLVREGKIIGMPNFIVGLVLPDGRFVRPHMIWLLPPDKGVLNMPEVKGFRYGPLQKFRSVYYGLVHALAELGADAMAPATSQITKNPLCELYHTECGPDDFYTLEEHSRVLDMTKDRGSLVRENIAAVTGETFEASCEFYNGCLDAARKLMLQWHRGSDVVYKQAMKTGDRDALLDRVQAALSVMDCKTMREKSKEYARWKVSNWVVSWWNVDKLAKDEHQTRHRLQNEVRDIHTVKGRQAVAGRYSAQVNADRTLAKLVEAYDAFKAEGVEITKSGLAKLSGLARNTVRNRFDDLESFISSRPAQNALTDIEVGVVRKQSNTTTLNPPTSQTVDPDLAAAMVDAWMVDGYSAGREPDPHDLFTYTDPADEQED